MRFVVDTNILVSAALFPSSIPAKALNIVLNSGKLLFSAETKNELLKVLNRPKFNKYFNEGQKENFFLSFIKVETLVSPNIKIMECRDFKDNMFLELALFSKAHYIITGDQDLLIMNPFKGIPILSSQDFIDNFTANK